MYIYIIPVEVIIGIHPGNLEEIINEKLAEDNRYVLLHVVPEVSGQSSYTRFAAIFQAPPPPVEAEAEFVQVLENGTPVARALPDPVVAVRGRGGRKSRRRRLKKQKKTRKH